MTPNDRQQANGKDSATRVTTHHTITDLDAAKALIAAGNKLLEVHFEAREGDRRALAPVPAEWVIERHDH